MASITFAIFSSIFATLYSVAACRTSMGTTASGDVPVAEVCTEGSPLAFGNAFSTTAQFVEERVIIGM